MQSRYKSDPPRARLDKRLATYSSDARRYRARDTKRAGSRLVKNGSLAALIPLAAAAGDLNAQCTSAPPLGQFSIVDGNPLNIPLGNGDSITLRLQENGAWRTLWVSGSGVNILASGPFYTSIGPYYRARFYSLSVAVSPTGSTQPTPYLCYNGSIHPANGNFCPPASGAVAFRVTSDSRLGWMELSVDSFGPGLAVVTIGQRGIQFGPSSTIHPGDCASLPVELVSFDAVSADDGVILSWETASELNSAGFDVERATDSDTFHKIAFIEGHGTTTEAHRYSFSDESVEPNTQYRYRLRQIDFDGTTSFSEIIEMFTEDPSQIGLSEFYPNPAGSGHTTLQINVADEVEANVDLYDVRGALVDSRSTFLSAGQNRLRFETDRLATGSHFAKVQVGERVIYRQFVVSR